MSKKEISFTEGPVFQSLLRFAIPVLGALILQAAYGAVDLLSKGYPKELCAEIAYKNMNTDYTATRMLGYLYRYTNPKIEDLVDEMLAILSDRAQIIEKKESEHAQAVISEMYRKGL